MSINICDLCYDLSAASCYGTLYLQVGKTPNTPYTVFVEDKFGHLFTQSTMSDGVGNILLIMDDFPEGMFTPYSGFYTFSVSDNAQLPSYENMTIDGDVYNCIKATFVDVD